MLLEIGLFKKKQNKTKQSKTKTTTKKIQIALSLGYPNSYFYNKRFIIPLINSLGRYWTDLVHSFRIPKVEHLSTLIIMFDQLQQIIKRLIRCWFSDYWPLMTAASSANWNQWMGFKNSREKPNWRYFSNIIWCRNVLKHKLKRSGLRQSPWSTPRPTDIKGVRNSFARIEVLKSV